MGFSQNTWSAEIRDMWQSAPEKKLALQNAILEFFKTERTYIDSLKTFTSEMEKRLPELSAEDRVFYSQQLNVMKNIIANQPFLTAQAQQAYATIIANTASKPEGDVKQRLEAENESNLHVLYNSIIHGVESEAYRHYQRNNLLATEAYNAILQFTMRGLNAAIQDDLKAVTNYSASDFHILPVQRPIRIADLIDRFVKDTKMDTLKVNGRFILDEDNKPVKVDIKTPESEQFVIAASIVRADVIRINSVKAATTLSVLAFGKLEASLQHAAKELAQPSKGNANNLTRSLGLAKVQALQSLFSELKYPVFSLSNPAEANKTTLTVLEASIKNKIAAKQPLSANEQMFLNVQNLLLADKIEPKLMIAYSTLAATVAQEMQYQTCISALAVAKELNQLDEFGILPSKMYDSSALNTFSKNAYSELNTNRNEVSVELTNLNQTLFNELKELPESLRASVLAIQTPVPPIESTFAATLMTNFPRPPSENSSKSDVSSTQVQTLEPDLKKSLDNFKNSIKENATQQVNNILLSVERSVILRDVNDKVNASTQLLTEVKAEVDRSSSLETIRESLRSNRPQSLEQLSQRKDFIGETAKRWVNNNDPTMQANVVEITTALNHLSLHQASLHGVQNLEKMLTTFETQTNLLIQDLQTVTRRDDISAATKQAVKSAIETLENTNLSTINQLREQLNKQKNIIEKMSAQENRVLQTATNNINTAKNVTAEQMVVSEVSRQAQQLQTRFQSLQTTLLQPGKVNKTFKPLHELGKSNNYVGLVARKWLDSQNYSVNEPLAKLITTINRINSKKNSLQELEEQLKSVQDLKQEIQQQQSHWKNSESLRKFSSENKATISRLTNPIELAELDSLDNKIKAKMADIQKEVRQEYKTLATQDANLEDIRRKNAVRSFEMTGESIPFQDQMKRYSELLSTELKELSAKIHYQAEHAPAGSRQQQDLQRTMAELLHFQTTNQRLFKPPHSMENLQSIAGAMEAAKLSDNSHTKAFTQGFSAAYERLKTNSAQPLAKYAAQAAEVKIQIPKTNNILVKLATVEEFSNNMIAALQERKPLTNGDQLKAITREIADYQNVLKVSERYRAKLIQGMVSREQLAEFEKAQTLKSIHPDVKSVLKEAHSKTKQLMASTSKETSVYSNKGPTLFGLVDQVKQAVQEIPNLTKRK